MRHRVHKKSFQRDEAQRKALMRGLVCSLVEHGRIKTTLAKAKELRRHAERAVTIGKKGTVHARRVLFAKYPQKKTVKALVDKLAPQMKDRPGGYTRILKLARRGGDNAKMALIEFVNYSRQEHVAQQVELSDKEKKKLEKLAISKKQKDRAISREIKEASRKRNRQ